ncbi:efflux RND transporter periplasmic adaptor subunit [Amorphus orientalis]|uniref:Membrane fusion protein (Multidrug efflux system) n=1 Tax=Amorphus orientalis TaxID=649198 RepID=A0AAE4ATB3_9HYPH|nr:efflux RND transporter periplasmic adaptor subunit [Amorphus orientalis]MDQ0315945.1 membrane fusion protein (multidrug efflux system) [Amorphus orientalis]
MGVFRQVLIVAVLAGLSLAGYEAYRTYGLPGQEAANGQGGGPPQRAVSVEVAPADVATLTRQVEAVGTTRALRSIDIVPSAEGRITALQVQAGQEVADNAVIATIDDEIETATLSEAKASLEEKTQALERARTLIRSNTISQANLEQLRSEFAIAEAALARAERRLADRTVRAPFSGVVGILSVDLGARVDTDTVLTTLDDLSEVEIEFRLPETVYGQISQDQKVEATSAAFPDREFAGRVVAIDSRIDQASRSFRVRARIPNPDRTLPVGMFMRLDLSLTSREGVVVPEEALLVQGPATYLFVVEDGTAHRRKVETGKRQDGTVEITDGVDAGALVVSRGIQSLRDGAPVRVLNDPADASASPNAAEVRSEGKRT